MHPTYIYGIDFGTTNSALAILDVAQNEIVHLITVPSLLFFPDQQNPRAPLRYFVGKTAVEQYVESRMQGRFMKSIKRTLPHKSFQGTYIGNKKMKSEDLIALIISHLKQAADQWLGTTITTAVLGRPVVFDERQEYDMLAQQRLEKAARIAGFQQLYFQFEPLGAALAYERHLRVPELVLVGDFGGGTSDFSLMRLDPAATHNPDRKGDMLAKGGIYVGGDSFDSAIMWQKGTPHFGRGVKEQYAKGKWLDLPIAYFTNICSWEKMNFLDNVRMRAAIQKSYFFSDKNPKVKNLLTLIEKNLGYLLFKQIEKVKIDLSQADSTALRFQTEDIDIEEPIDLEDFAQNIIHKDIERILDSLRSFLQHHKLDKATIQTVFMTGGTSLVRPLFDAFAQTFGRDKLKEGDSFNSVVKGIAYSYRILAS